MADQEGSDSLTEQFPALRRLEAHRKNHIPVIQSLEMTDCGPACLAMVLGYYGKNIHLEEVRRIAGTAREGTSALTLKQAGRWFGLRGRGIRIELEGLEFLPKGAILHWDLNHFVVFDRLARKGVHIVDPAYGRNCVPLEQFRRSFTGVALVFEPSDEFEPSPRSDNLLWQYLGRILSHSGILLRLMIISLLVQVVGLAMPILTGVLVDRIIPQGNYHLLGVLSVGLSVIVLFNLLSAMLRAHLLLHLGTNLNASMTLDFLSHLVDLPYAFFQRRTAGDLMMRLGSHARIRDTLTASAMSTVLDGFFVMVYLVIMMLLSGSMGIVVVGLGILQIITFVLARRPYKDLMAESLQVQAKSQGYQVELLSGIETLKTAGAEQRAVERWSHLFTDTLNVYLKSGRLSAKVEPVLSALNTVSMLTILGFGGYLVMEGRLTLGTMLALNALAINFLRPLSALVNTGIQIQLLGPHLERIGEVLRTEKEQDRHGVYAAPQLDGSMRVEHVSFQYDPLSPQVLSDVTGEIETGQFVAIVGPSGSGKSTLASLLVGLYQPTSGKIVYGNVDLVSVDIKAIRSQIGIVTQHPYLFGASIKDNLMLNDPGASLESIINAARTAHIHDDIAKMSMGYETLLANGGTNLSGGQRQRLALARALVRRPRILLLDEATSALDTVTEKHIQEELESLQCTRIVIAQRLSTIMNADQIWVVQDGRIVERGRCDELIRLGGVFESLVSAQIRK